MATRLSLTDDALFAPNRMQAIGGGHWGVLETAKPKKKSSKTVKPQKNLAKTENRIQNRQKTDTMVTSAAYRANYTNTLFHQSICECHGLV